MYVSDSAKTHGGLMLPAALLRDSLPTSQVSNNFKYGSQADELTRY